MNTDNRDTEHIGKLLTRYYNGESTLAEEQTLRTYFSGDSTDPAFSVDKAMFTALSQPVSAPPALREAVTAAIRDRQRTELRRRMRFIYSRIAGAAAVLIISIAVSAHFLTQTPTPAEITPDQARRQTLMALTLLTTSVNKGIVAMEHSAQTASESISSAQRALNRTSSKNQTNTPS